MQIRNHFENIMFLSDDNRRYSRTAVYSWLKKCIGTGVILLMESKNLCSMAISSLRAIWVYDNRIDKQYVKIGNKSYLYRWISIDTLLKLLEKPKILRFILKTVDIWTSKYMMESNITFRSLTELTLSKNVLPKQHDIC